MSATIIIGGNKVASDSIRAIHTGLWNGSPHITVEFKDGRKVYLQRWSEEHAMNEALAIVRQLEELEPESWVRD